MKRNTKFRGERPIGAPVPGGQLVDYRPQEVSVSLAGKRGAGPLGGGNRKINGIGKPVPTRRG